MTDNEKLTLFERRLAALEASLKACGNFLVLDSDYSLSADDQAPSFTFSAPVEGSVSVALSCDFIKSTKVTAKLNEIKMWAYKPDIGKNTLYFNGACTAGENLLTFEFNDRDAFSRPYTVTVYGPVSRQADKSYLTVANSLEAPTVFLYDGQKSEGTLYFIEEDDLVKKLSVKDVLSGAISLSDDQSILLATTDLDQNLSIRRVNLTTFEQTPTDFTMERVKKVTGYQKGGEKGFLIKADRSLISVMLSDGAFKVTALPVKDVGDFYSSPEVDGKFVAVDYSGEVNLYEE